MRPVKFEETGLVHLQFDELQVLGTMEDCVEPLVFLYSFAFAVPVAASRFDGIICGS